MVKPKKIKFRPAFKSGKGKEHDAYTIPVLPGMCVHTCEFEGRSMLNEWAVSHIESGRNLLYGETRELAVQAAIDKFNGVDIEKLVSEELAKWQAAEERERLITEIRDGIQLLSLGKLREVKAIVEGKE